MVVPAVVPDFGNSTVVDRKIVVHLVHSYEDDKDLSPLDVIPSMVGIGRRGDVLLIIALGYLRFVHHSSVLVEVRFRIFVRSSVRLKIIVILVTIDKNVEGSYQLVTEVVIRLILEIMAV